MCRIKSTLSSFFRHLSSLITFKYFPLPTFWKDSLLRKSRMLCDLVDEQQQQTFYEKTNISGVERRWNLLNYNEKILKLRVFKSLKLSNDVRLCICSPLRKANRGAWTQTLCLMSKELCKNALTERIAGYFTSAL